MFRLKDNQLHIILGIVFAAAVIISALFCFAGRGHHLLRRSLSPLKNFSDGWVANYETTDERKWKEYSGSSSDKTYGIITEVVNLPQEFKTRKDGVIVLTHKIPILEEDYYYFVFRTGKQHVVISINDIVMFDSMDDSFPYHILEINRDYQGRDMTVTINSGDDDIVSFGEMKAGTFTQLMADAYMENGSYTLFGAFLILVSVCMLLIKTFANNTIRKKMLINYCSLEGLAIGAAFMIQSRLIRNIINWEFICYFILCCLVIIASITHLLVIRCMIYKKKILSVVDIGVLVYSIVFISILVLQWFGLLTFGTVYRLEMLLFAAGIIIYTLLMGSASYDYKQREGKPAFIANLILIGFSVLEAVIDIAGLVDGSAKAPLIIGWLSYFVILWVYGIKILVNIEVKQKNSEANEQLIRQQIIEQFNPNLLFASFKTLQNLIKNGSNQSIKMIYYISVYVRGNLRAMSSDSEIIGFDEELEHIMSYLQLQKTRNSKLGFSIECKVKDFRVPRHSIEPMVEKAVKYGVAGKDNKGNVVIRTYEREEGYAVQIIDDGIGFDYSRLKKHSPTSLKNLFNILEENCEAKTEVISREGKGTVITVILPVIDNELIDDDQVDDDTYLDLN